MDAMLMLVSGHGLVDVFVWLIIAGLLFWVAIWFLNWVGIPEPFNKIAKVVIGLIAFIMVVNALFSLGGHPIFTWW